MSHRRRLLVFAVAAALLVAVAVVGVRLLPGRGAPAPAQDRPGPVLLIPGYGGGTGALDVLAARIRATGRQATVLALPGEGTGDLGAQVAVLDAAVGAARAAGAPSVDIVGYSAGGVVAGLWIARAGGAADARRMITLGSPLHGAQLAGLGAALLPSACPAACRQLVPGSPVLGELATGEVGTRLPWLSIWTADDETVTPPDSARLDGAVNVEVQSICPGAVLGHGRLPTDPVVTGLVLRALLAAPLAAPEPSDCASLRAAGSR